VPEIRLLDERGGPPVDLEEALVDCRHLVWHATIMTSAAARISVGATRNMRLALGALGVVFGDIGTSPLYAFRESFIGARRLPVDQVHVLGVLSLIVWALIVVVTIKYVLITMRADNRGEGGSFALLALIRRVLPRARLLPAISFGALLATALFYGDAVITPAISILSAVEGLTLANDRFGIAVIPLTLIITLALFAIQHRGTGLVGRFFGPVMLVWFIIIGVLGAVNVASRPSVLEGVSPSFALGLIASDPLRAFVTLGTVVLTITGAEALYADMGALRPAPNRARMDERGLAGSAALLRRSGCAGSR
jgi:KUP system potassium uptake protein